MTKKIIFLCAFLLSYQTLLFSTPVIEIKSAMSPGFYITFWITGTNEDTPTPVQIDFGDGKIVDYEIYGRWYFEEKMKGTSIVKIYGDISVLECGFGDLESIDISLDTLLTKLNCSSKGITSLDISKNKALVEVDCSNNNMTQLILGANSNLKRLDCSTNMISSIDLSHCPELTTLICEYNQISNLDVTKNSKLERIWCYNLSINSLDLSKNLALTALNCRGNNLTSLDLSKNVNLRQLDCSNIRISSLDVSKNIALSQLYCFGNQLSSLDLSNNISLSELMCFNNQLSSLDLSNNISLTNINCSNNNLSSIIINPDIATPSFGLDCSFNNLNFVTLPFIPVGYYAYSPQYDYKIPKEIASEIDLSSQNLEDRTWYIWKTTKGALLNSSEVFVLRGNCFFYSFMEDSVFCEIANYAFPKLTLKTTKTKIIELSTSINPIDSKEIVISVSEKTLLIHAPSIANISVFDLNGRQILNKQLTNSDIRIDGLQNGIYIVSIQYNTRVVNRKVVLY